MEALSDKRNPAKQKIKMNTLKQQLTSKSFGKEMRLLEER